MDRTKRRSRRLAEKRRRTRGRSGKKRMSVGDAFGVRAHEGVDVTNLAEANAMNSAYAAAERLTERKKAKPANARASAKAYKSGRKRNERSKRKGRSRARSLSPQRAKVPACDRSAASSTRATRQRRASSARASLEARELTKDLFDSGDEPPALMDTSGGERKTESEGEEGDFAGMDAEHAAWEREHRAHLSAIETPASQRAQPNSGDDGFIVSDGQDTIFDSQDSDYRASATEESSFHTVSEADDAEYQDRLAIVVRNSVEEVAEENEQKPSEGEEDGGEAKYNSSAVPVERKPDPRSTKKKPAKKEASAAAVPVTPSPQTHKQDGFETQDHLTRT